jgi:hypothetical protein
LSTVPRAIGTNHFATVVDTVLLLKHLEGQPRVCGRTQNTDSEGYEWIQTHTSIYRNFFVNQTIQKDMDQSESDTWQYVVGMD